MTNNIGDLTVSNTVTSQSSSAPSILVNGSTSATVVTGSTITITVADGPGDPRDWIGWYAPGSLIESGAPGGPWVYVNGTQVAPSTGLSSFHVMMAAPAISGSYEMRFYADDSYNLVAHVAFAVGAPPPPPPPLPPRRRG